jgi:aquaporin Z
MALTYFIYLGAGYSGAHYNPAVTVALMITKHIGPVDGIIYIVFQLLGGALAG